MSLKRWPQKDGYNGLPSKFLEVAKLLEFPCVDKKLIKGFYTLCEGSKSLSSENGHAGLFLDYHCLVTFNLVFSVIKISNHSQIFSGRPFQGRNKLCLYFYATFKFERRLNEFHGWLRILKRLIGFFALILDSSMQKNVQVVICLSFWE